MNDIEGDLRTVRRALRAAGVPARLLLRIETRSYKTGRRQTGEFQTNRDNRWVLTENHPEFCSRENCVRIQLRLLAMLMEFHGAPELPPDIVQLLQRHLGRQLRRGEYRDPLTRERLSYQRVAEEAVRPRHGHSSLHIGHLNPRIRPRHVPENVDWRADRSNLIQGDLTLAEARTWIVEMIARYFDLGEVRITPD